MTQEEKRIKIAEACGWTSIRFTGGILTPRQLTGCIPNDNQRCAVPDYFNDLNACHEARSNLNSDQKERYVGKLCEFSEMGGYDGYDSLEWCIVDSGAAPQAAALFHILYPSR